MKKLITLFLFLPLMVLGQATGVNMGNYPSGGSLGSAVTTVDINSFMNIQQTTAGQVITIPTPTNVLAGKNITINNTGTASVILQPGGYLLPGSAIVYRWTGIWIVSATGMPTMDESSNLIYASPDGSTGTPLFRSMVWNDIPTSSVTPGTYNTLTVGSHGEVTSASNTSYLTATSTNTLTNKSGNISQWSNDSGYLTGITSGNIITALGFTPYSALNPSGFVSDLSSFSTTNLTEGSNKYYTDSRARSAISLTTIGTSGSATYNSSTGVFNIPQYNSGTVTSVALSMPSAFTVSNSPITGSGTLTVTGAGSSSQYINGAGALVTFPSLTSGTVTSIGISSSDFSISGSPVTSSGNITANLNTTGISAGLYSGSITVDAKGRITAANNLSFNNSPSITIQTVAASANGNQLSATRNTFVNYSLTIVSTATISGSASGYVVLEICPTNSSTASDWIEIGRVPNGQAVSLAVVLQSVSTGGGQVTGIVPVGYYRRLRSVNISGTPTYTYNSGQEIIQ